MVEDWEKTPEYQRDLNGRVTVWDFYGGSLVVIGESFLIWKTLE